MFRLLVEEFDDVVQFVRLLEPGDMGAVNNRAKHRLRNREEGVNEVQIYVLKVDPKRDRCMKEDDGTVIKHRG